MAGNWQDGQDGSVMAKPPGDVKKDRAWFERKVAELKAELEKLPADRREQAGRELEEPKAET